MEKMAIILGTSRTDGNTRQLVSAVETACSADVFFLQDFEISVFDYDHKNRNDDFTGLIKNLLEYDHWAFATPIYWYTMSAQMKVFVDRFSDLLTIEKDLGRRLRGQQCSVISTGVSSTPPDCFEAVFKHTFDYLGMDYRNTLYCDFTSEVKEQNLLSLVKAYIEKSAS